MKHNRIPIFLTATGLFWFSMYAYMPVLANYASNGLHASTFMLSLIVGSYGFTQMMMRIPLGVVSDKLRVRKPFILLGFALSLIAAVGMALSRSPAAILVFRGVSGLAAASWVSFTVLYASYHEAKQATRSMGIITAVSGVGQMLSMLVGGELARRVGPQATFWLAAAATVPGAAAALFIVDNPPKTPPLKIIELLKVGLNKRLLSAAFLTILVQCISFATVFNYTQQFAKAVLHMNDSQIGMLQTLNMLGNILAARLVASKLASRFSQRACVCAGFLLVAACVAWIPLTASPLPLYFSQMLCGAGLGMTSALLMAMSIGDIAPEKRGAAMGFYQSIYGLGMFVGPLMAGAIASSAGISAVFYSMAGMAVVAAGLDAWLFRKRGQASQSIAGRAE